MSAEYWCCYLALSVHPPVWWWPLVASLFPHPAETDRLYPMGTHLGETMGAQTCLQTSPRCYLSNSILFIHVTVLIACFLYQYPHYHYTNITSLANTYTVDKSSDNVGIIHNRAHVSYTLEESWGNLLWTTSLVYKVLLPRGSTKQQAGIDSLSLGWYTN